jgi:predicted nucleic acid-binding protein
VPSLWLVEVTNVLAMAERHGRLDAARVDGFLEGLLALPVDLDHGEPGVLGPALVRIARAQRLTAYDAAYLELAMRLGLPLATQDASLQTAAERVGVSLFAS